MKKVIEGWVAADEFADTCKTLYTEVPPRRMKQMGYFLGESGSKRYHLDNKMFPEVTWENSPVKVRVTLETIE